MHSVLSNSKDYFLFNIMENIHWHKALTIHSCVRCYMYSFYPQIRVRLNGEYAQMHYHTKQIHSQQNFKERKAVCTFLDLQNNKRKRRKNPCYSQPFGITL